MSFLALVALQAAVLSVSADADPNARAPRPAGPVRHATLTIDTRQVEAVLTPVRILAADARIVLGQRDGADLPLAVGTDLRIWRGTLPAFPDGRVFLVEGRRTIGTVDLGTAGGRFVLRAGEGGLSARPMVAAPHGLPVPLCGVVDAETQPVVSRGATELVRPDTRLLRLAIETDYELYSLFDDTEAELAYLLEMYAAVSEIFVRDVNTRIELTFIRLWTQPNDRFNQPDPLGIFRQHWQNNMSQVPRDLAQFCSGRRDLPYGGVAYLSGICNSSGYSVTGYNLGFVYDPEQVHGYNRDIIINAHELGHNYAARHAHDYGYDTCDEPSGAPERGTIMSYCGQTRSGGDGNIDLRFDSRIASVMRNYASTTCLAIDCDTDSVPDPGAAPDENGNGVPDGCEDCNGNGVLDPNDLAGGGSVDVDLDEVPDECQADCNGNGLPDRYDIAFGLAEDLDFNGVPDGCQTDCDGDGTADLVQMEGDMQLDLNRNAVLDACEDCDGDGTLDDAALGGAYNVWMGVHQEERIYEFHARSGVKVTTGPAVGIGHTNDLQITSDGRILVSDGPNARIVELDADGAFVRDLVTPGAGGLQNPKGMLLRDDGTVLVVDKPAPAVRRYDLASGAYLGEMVAAADLVAPFGIAASSRGTFCVSEQDGRVLEFDAGSGALVRELVTLGDNGGLANPHGLLFTPDGRLLVCSRDTDQVLEYDGDSGAFLRQFNNGGTANRLTLNQPFGIRLGPDNDIYVSRHGGHDHNDTGGGHLHLTDARIFHFDLESGNFVRAFVVGNDNSVGPANAFAFVPGRGMDCNFNQIPDNCEIASGAVLDRNGNGLPDSCDCLGDVNGDLVTDISDLAILLGNFGRKPAGPADGDLNGDGGVDLSDLALLVQAYGVPCLTPVR